MADDDRVVKDGQAPADPPAVEPSAQTFNQAAAARRPVADPASEWTASDSRGPLSIAEDDENEPRAPSAAAVKEAPAPETTGTIAHEPSEHVVIDRDPAPGHAASRPTAPLPPAEPKRPLWAVAAGIVIGAAIGAGSAAFVYRSVQGDVVSDEMTRLAARVDAIEKRPPAKGDAAALSQTVADLQSKVAALGTPGKDGDTPPPAAVDLAPLQARVEALQSSLSALKAESGGAKALAEKVAGFESKLNGMKSAASSAQAGVAAVQGEQKALADKVMVPALAVVADSLVQQIDQGQPYVSQVDALAALGADPVKIAVLRQNAGTGVPSAKVLSAKFEALAEPIAANPRPAPANAGFVERLKSGMFGLVSVRRADDISGNDPASRVARIKSDLAHDDIAGALVAWDGLPNEAKIKGEAWRALAKSHAEAMSAARALQHEAIASLGAKKS